MFKEGQKILFSLTTTADGSSLVQTWPMAGDILVVKWVAPCLKTWFVRGEKWQSIKVTQKMEKELETCFPEIPVLEIVSSFVEHLISFFSMSTGLCLECLMIEPNGWVFKLEQP